MRGYGLRGRWEAESVTGHREFWEGDLLAGRVGVG